FLLMFLLIFPFVMACDDDDDNSKSSSTVTYDLRFEVPDSTGSVVPDTITVYSLNKNTDPWQMDDVGDYDGYPFEVSGTAGTDYLEIVIPADLEDYDQQDKLTNAQLCETFGYRLIGSDGFTSRSDSSPDLTWELFQTGYLYNGDTAADNPRAWFPPFGDPTYPGYESPSGTDGGDWNGKYMMKVFTFLELRRMIQIVNNDVDSTTTYVTLNDYTSQSITYWNNSHDEQKSNEAIPMIDILTTDINADIADKYFIVTAADGYVNNDTLDTDNLYNTYDWAAMQQAYIVTNIEDAGTDDENPCSKGKIVFVDSSDSTQPYKSVKYVTKIEIADAIP
ncbi:MAG TPA: hypothetical protein PK341_18660, partial [Spirochaetota bacterium]|nr:hypothetical protein [Spirochaetota bacterium]